MEDGGYRHLPVVADGKLIGILSVKRIVHYLVEHFPPRHLLPRRKPAPANAKARGRHVFQRAGKGIGTLETCRHNIGLKWPPSLRRTVPSIL